MTPWSLAGRTLRLALPLYLATLVVGALPTALVMAGVGLLAGDRPWRSGLLGPGWLNLVAEMLATAIYTGGSAGTALIWLGLALALPAALLAQVVAYSFLAGGILESLGAAPGRAGHAGAPVPTSRSAFVAACRRWFWPNLRLSLLGSAIAITVTLPGAMLAGMVGGVLGPNVGFFTHAALQALVWGWLEAARAVIVTEDRRSVGDALWHGLRVAARPVALVVWLLLAVPAGGLVIAAALPPAISDPSSAAGLLTALVFGQCLAYLGAWTKVLRLAFALRLVKAAQGAPRRGAPVAVSRG